MLVIEEADVGGRVKLTKMGVLVEWHILLMWILGGWRDVSGGGEIYPYGSVEG